MATLKISDLSVGDWVEYEGLHYPITFVGYGEGGDGSLVNLIRPDLSCFTCKISGIHPIPITAEILEKNGFVKYSEREWGCNDDSPCHIFIHIDTPDETMWFISFPTIFNLVWDHPIYNIHELQHLIRLAGIDKGINL